MDRIAGKPAWYGKTHFLIWWAEKASRQQWLGHWAIYVNGAGTGGAPPLQCGVLPQARRSELQAERIAFEEGSARLDQLDANATGDAVAGACSSSKGLSFEGRVWDSNRPAPTGPSDGNPIRQKSGKALFSRSGMNDLLVALASDMPRLLANKDTFFREYEDRSEHILATTAPEDRKYVLGVLKAFIDRSGISRDAHDSHTA